MRIISGIYKGQIISSPHGHKTHPMSERMRGAMFNTLGDITGLTFLDAYAGSGAVGIEALSRGASKVTFIDIDKNANQTIRENINKLKLENVKNIKANSASWSDHNFETRFDIVIADPPYDHIVVEQLNKLTRNMKPGGLFILSVPKNLARPNIENLQMVEDKSFADGSIVFYRYSQNTKNKL